MQKMVVDAPDKLEKGESFGPGGVRINGKMKNQYKNPEKLEDYLRRENEIQCARGSNTIQNNEKTYDIITKVAESFILEFIYEGWRRYGDEVISLLWDGIDDFLQSVNGKNVIKANQIMDAPKDEALYPCNAVIFQKRQQSVSCKDKSVC